MLQRWSDIGGIAKEGDGSSGAGLKAEDDCVGGKGGR